MTDATLIGVDWGTSSLRAYRLGSEGVVLEKRELPLGIMRLLGQNHPASDDERAALFERACRQACGGWLEADPSIPVIGCGMIGSAQGWREAPYLAVPVDIDSIGLSLTHVVGQNGIVLHIVPGLIEHSELPNVMRGEESQITGALRIAARGKNAANGRNSSLLCLPGTHSKWVLVREDRIMHFETFMTGEVFSALCQHTILGQTMQPSEDASAFDRGVRVAQSSARRGSLLSMIFSTRTLGLTGALEATQQSDYLSGLLIGHEIASIQQGTDNSYFLQEILLVGNSALCLRYKRALLLFGCVDVRIISDATERGLWTIAVQGRLVESEPDRLESF